MSIRVLKPGVMATIQDGGRYGFQQYGVIVSGAMDSYSLQTANMLVGNDLFEAVIEITLMGTTLQFEDDAVIAITGGHLTPIMNGDPVPMNRAVYIQKDHILHFAACKSGSRAYISVAGGLDIPVVMNSKSTYLRARVGGYKGRSLRSGDRIAIQTKSPLITHVKEHKARWFVCPVPFKKVISVMKGPEFDRFSIEAKTAFFEQTFQLTTQSDRMGCRLSGPSLALEQPYDMLSEASTFGTIQVPADGNPIMLMADRQTTGGYPRIAQVISADLPSIGQLNPGDTIRFEEVTLQAAEQLYLKRLHDLEMMQQGILLKIKEAGGCDAN